MMWMWMSSADLLTVWKTLRHCCNMQYVSSKVTDALSHKVWCVKSPRKIKNKIPNTTSLVSWFVFFLSALPDSWYCLPCVESISWHCGTCTELPKASQEKAGRFLKIPEHLTFWKHKAKTPTLYCICYWWVSHNSPRVAGESYHKSPAVHSVLYTILQKVCCNAS